MFQTFLVAGTSESIYIFIDNSNVYIEGKKTVWHETVNEHLVKIDYP